MYVQDIKSPGINIAAAIPELHAYNFQKMCATYASAKSHGKFIDEYTLQLSSLQSTNKVKGIEERLIPNEIARKFDDSSEISIQSLKEALESVESKSRSESPKPSISKTSSSHAIAADNQCQKDSNDQAKIYQNRIDFQLVIDSIHERLDVKSDKLEKWYNRQLFTWEIPNILAGYVKDIDPAFDIIPFGSNQYYCYTSASNFNLFIFTGIFFFHKKLYNLVN